jgi:hypothetical protein
LATDHLVSGRHFKSWQARRPAIFHYSSLLSFRVKG